LYMITFIQPRQCPIASWKVRHVNFKAVICAWNSSADPQTTNDETNNQPTNPHVTGANRGICVWHCESHFETYNEENVMHPNDLFIMVGSEK